MSLYTHFAHPHVLKNVNELHKTEQTNLNARIGVFLTKHIGTMWAAYSFMVLAIVGFFAIIGVLPPTVALLVAWASQTFIQLVMLPVIMVGQNVLGRKAELQSDEMFATSQHSFSDIVQIMEHLDVQDQEILKIVKQLEILSGTGMRDIDKLREPSYPSKQYSKTRTLTPEFSIAEIT